MEICNANEYFTTIVIFSGEAIFCAANELIVLIQGPAQLRIFTKFIQFTIKSLNS